MAEFALNGTTPLTVTALVRAARDPRTRLRCDTSLVETNRGVVDRAIAKYREDFAAGRDPVLDYGVTTGFGEFKRVPIHPDKLPLLQENIILSHAAGVGVNADHQDITNYYTGEVVRAAMLLRLNAFLQGHSGVTKALVDHLVALFNLGVIPLVPIRGSVGSSGDLCPLAHLALVVFTRGRECSHYYRATERAHLLSHPGVRFGSDAKQPVVQPATNLGTDPDVRLPPHVLSAKEGLALTNGVTFSAAMLALAVHDAEQLANAADVAVALSLEAARGCARAFDERIHEARHQDGQIESSANIRHLLGGDGPRRSKLIESFAETQDPYSLRCAPAVHGASRDALAFAKTIATKEINACTDNPLFFDDVEPGRVAWDGLFRDNWAHRRDKAGALESYNGNERRSFSACNFHGQPIAVAADYLAIGLAELANISERRTQVLMDGDHNRGLPRNLIPNAGLNSGFMIAQYCAAGLVSENKVFAHPASVDSIPTSSNSEDHNSMATIAAVKLRHVLSTVRLTLAIELLVGAQAAEWAVLYAKYLWPNATSSNQDLQQAIANYRRAVSDKDNADPLKKRDATNAQGEAEEALFRTWAGACRADVQEYLAPATFSAYSAVRSAADAMVVDALLSRPIASVAALLSPEAEVAGTVALIDRVNGALPDGLKLGPSPVYARARG